MAVISIIGPKFRRYKTNLVVIEIKKSIKKAFESISSIRKLKIRKKIVDNEIIIKRCLFSINKLVEI
jgi:hypothetical protein